MNDVATWFFFLWIRFQPLLHCIRVLSAFAVQVSGRFHYSIPHKLVTEILFAVRLSDQAWRRLKSIRSNFLPDILHDVFPDLSS